MTDLENNFQLTIRKIIFNIDVMKNYIYRKLHFFKSKYYRNYNTSLLQEINFNYKYHIPNTILIQIL